MSDEIIQVPIKGAPCFYVPLEEESGALKMPATPKKYVFDNLAKGSSFELPASAAASEDKATYLEWKDNAGTTVQHLKTIRTLEALTGEVATTSSSGTSNTYKLTIVTNNCPMDLGTSAYINYKAWTKLLESMTDSPGLFVYPAGEDITGSFDNCGYIAILGKRSNAVKIGKADYDSPEPDTVEITASTLTIPDAVKTALIAAGFVPAIKRVGSTTSITLPQLTEEAITKFKSGKYCIL